MPSITGALRYFDGLTGWRLSDWCRRIPRSGNGISSCARIFRCKLCIDFWLSRKSIFSTAQRDRRPRFGFVYRIGVLVSFGCPLVEHGLSCRDNDCCHDDDENATSSRWFESVNHHVVGANVEFHAYTNVDRCRRPSFDRFVFQ